MTQDSNEGRSTPSYTLRLDKDDEGLGRYVVSKSEVGWSWVWIERDPDNGGWYNEFHAASYALPWEALRAVADDAEDCIGWPGNKLARTARGMATKLERASQPVA